jgi:hypothetical protein
VYTHVLNRITFTYYATSIPCYDLRVVLRVPGEPTKLKPGFSSIKDLKTSKLSSKKDTSFIEIFKCLKTINITLINPYLITLTLS